MKYYSEETVKKLLENSYYHELEDCPSIDIPDHHGRLIDADKLFNECEQFDLPNVMPDSLWVEANDLLNAPTVLEATE